MADSGAGWWRLARWSWAGARAEAWVRWRGRIEAWRGKTDGEGRGRGQAAGSSKHANVAARMYLVESQIDRSSLWTRGIGHISRADRVHAARDAIDQIGDVEDLRHVNGEPNDEWEGDA